MKRKVHFGEDTISTYEVEEKGKRRVKAKAPRGNPLLSDDQEKINKYILAKVKAQDFEVIKAQLEDYAKKYSNKTRAICNVLSKSKAIEYIFQKGNKKSFDFILDLLTLPNIINLFNQNGSQYLSLASIEGNIDSFDFIEHILGNSQIKTVDDNDILNQNEEAGLSI